MLNTNFLRQMLNSHHIKLPIERCGVKSTFNTFKKRLHQQKHRALQHSVIINCSEAILSSLKRSGSDCQLPPQLTVPHSIITHNPQQNDTQRAEVWSKKGQSVYRFLVFTLGSTTLRGEVTALATVIKQAETDAHTEPGKGHFYAPPPLQLL